MTREQPYIQRDVKGRIFTFKADASPLAEIVIKGETEEDAGERIYSWEICSTQGIYYPLKLESTQHLTVSDCLIEAIDRTKKELPIVSNFLETALEWLETEEANFERSPHS